MTRPMMRATPPASPATKIMLKHMLFCGVIAGFLAGLIATVLHFVFIQPLLLQGELYENGTLTHFAGAESTSDGHDHNQDHGGHDHAEGGGDGLRNVLTLIFTQLIYTAYALLLVAGFAVAGALGRVVSARDGLLWGLAGFAAFQLAPGLGISPELPGSAGAEITARQTWWVGTALATGLGIALLAYGRGLLAVGAAIVLLGLPHAIGAPLPDYFQGPAPPELSAEFAARVMGVGMVTWLSLGWLLGRFWTTEQATQ